MNKYKIKNKIEPSSLWRFFLKRHTGRCKSENTIPLLSNSFPKSPIFPFSGGWACTTILLTVIKPVFEEFISGRAFNKSGVASMVINLIFSLN
jgi:hypothetical protein